MERKPHASAWTVHGEGLLIPWSSLPQHQCRSAPDDLFIVGMGRCWIPAAGGAACVAVRPVKVTSPRGGVYNTTCVLLECVGDMMGSMDVG